MSASARKVNPYDLQKVILSPVSDEMQLDENFEPPFVRPRQTNSQYIEIDTSVHDAFTNPCSLSISLARSMPRVNRINMSFFAFRSFTPNINPRNNVFTFIVGATPYTATISADQNLTGLARYQALATAMNVATGVPGQFTVAVNPTYPSTFDITNTLATPYRFTVGGSGIDHGRYLWGFNERNTNIGTERVTQALTSHQESYTRYIDISSFELTQYTKIDISGANIPAEVIFRFLMTDVVYGGSYFNGFTDAPALNYERSRNLATLDLSILDEFNQLLYVPEQLWGSFLVYIVLIANM